MDSFNLIDENIALALQRELNVILSIACEALCRNPTDLSERLEHEGCADVRKRAQPYSCLNMPYRVWRAALNNQGNYYECRDYNGKVKNSNTYYYHNLDGGHFWNNPDGTTYYDFGHGDYIKYTTPDGGGWIERKGVRESIIPLVSGES